MAKAVKRPITESSLVREHKFTMLLTKEERTQLQEIADHRGLTPSDLLRQWIRETHRAVA